MLNSYVSDEGEILRQINFDNVERGGDRPHITEGFVINIWIFEVKNLNIKDGFAVDAVLELGLIRNS